MPDLTTCLSHLLCLISSGRDDKYSSEKGCDNVGHSKHSDAWPSRVSGKGLGVQFSLGKCLTCLYVNCTLYDLKEAKVLNRICLSVGDVV